MFINKCLLQNSKYTSKQSHFSQSRKKYVLCINVLIKSMSLENIQCFFVLFDNFSYLRLLENQRANGMASDGRVMTANAAQSI